MPPQNQASRECTLDKRLSPLGIFPGVARRGQAHCALRDNHVSDEWPPDRRQRLLPTNCLQQTLGLVRSDSRRARESRIAFLYSTTAASRSPLFRSELAR